MWTDMQKELGDNPDAAHRACFKRKWCQEHFPEDGVYNDCFLCAYAIPEWNKRKDEDTDSCTKFCPIDWAKAGLVDCCSECDGGGEFYEHAPISEILDLPEREDV
jgi:hypothetical protein